MPAPVTARIQAIDLLRGAAMLWMTAFHFCFDLQYFGYLQANFYADPFWTLQRLAIVSLFVFCAGLGQAAAVHQGQTWARFWRRWWQIALCALAVSVGSWFMFPQSFISFGILHGMALMVLLARLLLSRLPDTGWSADTGAVVLLLLGAVALALPSVAVQMHALWPELDFLNARGWNWLGLISRKPITEDYAPVFPWLGVLCWGLACGLWLQRRRTQEAPVVSMERSWSGLAWLAWLGRHSLAYYMLHQPLLIGAFSLLAWLRPAGVA